MPSSNTMFIANTCAIMTIMAFIVFIIPLDSNFATPTFILLTLFGSLGHWLLRQYLNSRPDVKNTLFKASLLILSYSAQSLSFIMTLFSPFHLDWISVWLQKFIINYPLIACSVISPVISLGLIPVHYSILVYLLTKLLQKFFPTIYVNMNHDRVSKVAMRGPVAVLVSYFGVQAALCHNTCEAALFNKFARVMSRLNTTIEQDACSIPINGPFVFVTHLCLITYIVLLLGKGLRTLKSKLVTLKKSIFKQKPPMLINTFENNGFV